MPVTANDLAWDATHGLLLLSIPSTVGPGGNVIEAIDPIAGTTIRTQFAGSEPDRLAISDDDQYLYVGLDGSASVRRFLLPSLTPDISYSLGRNSLGPFVAVDLQVAPGASRTTAVSSGNPGFSPMADGGITVFDDATPRPTVAPAVFAAYDSIQWGATNSTIYAANNETSSFDFYTLAVDSDGVQSTGDHQNVFDSYGNHIHFDPTTGLVYSDDGIVVNPSTALPAGTYAAAGPLALDSSVNTVYFAGNCCGGHGIESFNQTQFTPISTTLLTNLTNVTDVPQRLTRWGAQGLALITQGGSVYLTGTHADTVGATFGGVPLGSANVLSVSLAVNDIAWDSLHGVIYASVPSTGGANGNSVVAIDPATGAITASQFAGSEPTILAISHDDQFLYVGLNGSSSVERFILPALTPDITIPLGSGSSGAYYALDLQVAPGAPHTIAVTLGSPNISPVAQGGIVIYDDAMARPVTAPGPGRLGGNYDSLQWGHDATVLYASNDENTGFEFYALTVDSSGVQPAGSYPGAFPSFYGRIHYDQTTGLIYDDDGHTASPATGLPTGIFSSSGLMIPDGALNTAFFLGVGTALTGESGYIVESYDMTRYTPISYVPVAGVSDAPGSGPTRMIRWGSDGLAFCTESGIYIISGSLVSGSPSVQTSESASLRETVHRIWPGPHGKLLPTKEDMQQRILKAALLRRAENRTE